MLFLTETWDELPVARSTRLCRSDVVQVTSGNVLAQLVRLSHLILILAELFPDSFGEWMILCSGFGLLHHNLLLRQRSKSAHGKVIKKHVEGLLLTT